ncbi:MAG: TIGR02266 family protein [Deltaproteobacteria bacterium]|nr:TIGR02266 family protein [Deltaproteobacteria bacterium]
MDGTKDTNLRQGRRARVDYDLEVDVGTESMFYTGLIRDISSGGLFVATDNVHRIGERLQVRFTFPGMDKPIEATGMVRWVRDPFGSPGLPPGVGVQFEDLPEEIAGKVNRYIGKRDVLIFDEWTADTDW